MGLSATGFGLLLAMSAVGAIIGSAIAPWTERTLGRTRALTVALCIFPVIGLTPALTTSVLAFAAALVISGVFNVVWNVITVSLRQRIVPDAMLGRVNAGYRLVAWGTMPLGALLGGLLASAFGIRSVFWVSAALGLLCVPILRGRVSDAAIADAEAATEAATPPRP
jgi:MFS family permease